MIQAGMFDQKSTGTERKAFLVAILEEEQNDEEVSRPGRGSPSHLRPGLYYKL